jgi:hypothetical protein
MHEVKVEKLYLILKYEQTAFRSIQDGTKCLSRQAVGCSNAEHDEVPGNG